MSKLTYKFIAEGQDVITYGEVGDKFYIILSGTVSIWVPDTQKVEVKPEEYVFELYF